MQDVQLRHINRR